MELLKKRPKGIAEEKTKRNWRRKEQKKLVKKRTKGIGEESWDALAKEEEE